MTTKHKNIGQLALLILSVMIMAPACTKPELEDDFPKGDPPPIGNYTNSNEIAPADLVAYFPFDGTYADSKNGVPGGTLVGRGGGFTDGRKGQAYQAGDSSFITYTSAGPLASLTSFTVSLWINVAPHPSDAEGLFMVSRADGNFWGNFFMLMESSKPGDSVVMKTHFEKVVTPPIPGVENWIQPRVTPDVFNAWRHIAVTYNETTSEVSWYISGNKINLGADAIRKSGVGTNLLGPLSFKDAARFIVGGYQNHLGSPPYNGLEVWMRTYTGKMDELRFYKKALTGQEVNALFRLERQGR